MYEEKTIVGARACHQNIWRQWGNNRNRNTAQVLKKQFTSTHSCCKEKPSPCVWLIVGQSRAWQCWQLRAGAGQSQLTGGGEEAVRCCHIYRYLDTWLLELSTNLRQVSQCPKSRRRPLLRTFSLLKAPKSSFTIKNLLRHLSTYMICSRDLLRALWNFAKNRWQLYWLQCRSRRTIECSQGGVLSFSPECGQWSRSYWSGPGQWRLKFNKY